MTLYERIQKVPTKQKAAIGALVGLVVVAAYYFLLYAPVGEERQSLLRRQKSLADEKASYEAKRQDYLSFRTEVARLLEERKEIIRMLPKEDEIASFLDGVHAQADLAGLEVQIFEPKPEVPVNFYAKIPVAMQISGAFHRVAKFFRNLGEMKRIVNVENLSVGTPKEEDKQVVVLAKFTASTFRFVERGAAPPPTKGPPKKGRP